MTTWAIWLLLLAASFAAIEAWRLYTGGITLSRFVWNASKAWPPFPWVAGLLTGFLAAHFWWGGALICY